MKGAIASVELFAHEKVGMSPRRLTLTLSAPERVRDEGEEGAADEWVCRIVLADLHRPESLTAPDSLSALAAALEQGRRWLDALGREGVRITRDRDGKIDFLWSTFGQI